MVALTELVVLSAVAREMLRGCGLRLGLAVAAKAAASAVMAKHKGTFGVDVLESCGVTPDSIRDGAEPNQLCFDFTGSAATANGDEVSRGALATLADVFTTVHLWARDPKLNHVSNSFTMHIVRPPRVGRALECRTTVPKAGRRLAFTEFEFVDTTDGCVVARGSHIKSMVDAKR